MTELPDIHAMDPDQWFEDVQRHAADLKKEIRRCLDESESLQALEEALEPVLKPYVVDADEPVHGEQILAEIKYGEKLFLGVMSGDWMPLTYRDGGYWWFEGAQPRSGDGDIAALHDHIARRTVEATTWGDEELARRRAQEEAEHRRIGESYLQALEASLETDESTAGDLREALHQLVDDCIDDDDVVMADASPGDHHTHIELYRGGELYSRILAVDVAEKCFIDHIAGDVGVADEELSTVGVGTDHLHFRWAMFDEGPRPVTLTLPSERQGDTAQYYADIDWVVRNIRRVVRGE